MDWSNLDALNAVSRSRGFPIGQPPARTSDRIRSRLRARNWRHHAADNIFDVMEAGELDAMEAEAVPLVAEVLRALVIDVDRDPEAMDLARQITTELVREAFAGRYVQLAAEPMAGPVWAADDDAGLYGEGS